MDELLITFLIQDSEMGIKACRFCVHILFIPRVIYSRESCKVTSSEIRLHAKRGASTLCADACIRKLSARSLFSKTCIELARAA